MSSEYNTVGSLEDIPEQQVPGLKLVYVSGPYTQGDPVTNTQNAVKAGEVLLTKGYVPIIPHLSMLWHMMSPHDYRYWMDYDMKLLAMCEIMVRLPGESSGAEEELDWWVAHDVPWTKFYYVEEL